MKILSLLIGLWISHHSPNAVQFRKYAWLLALPARASGGQRDWLPAALLALISLLAGGLIIWLAEAMAGLFGMLLVGVAGVFYTLGPAHLDRDIQRASNPLEPELQQLALERLLLHPESTAIQAAGASLHAALARWFGIVFWFAVLGLPGCLLYRAVRETHHDPRLQSAERAWIGRLLGWLNWPVVLLMVGAIALMTDYDRVRAAFRAREDRWQLPAALLDDMANILCDPGGDLAEGLGDGRKLAWRALGLWLAVLSLMLLAGWIH